MANRQVRALKPRGRKRKHRPSTRRLVQRVGTLPIVRLNREKQWRDVYHRMLTFSWPRFFGVMALWYIGANVTFALLYMVDPNGIAEARPGSFEDHFFFSVQTIATIGYGVMHPQTLYANLVMTVETLAGLIFFAVLTGLVFARFSRPTARILFSDVAVVTPHNGVPTLMFRCANQRLNQILEANIGVTVLRDEISAEGRTLRRFHDLKLLRQRTPVFALTWTVMHPIDTESPLHGLTAADMAGDDALELVVVLTGVDETFAQPIQARHSYVADEILWDHHFVDIVVELDDGRPAIDYSRFHDIHPSGETAPD
ncbi:MAG: ATP-sensitive inward rectifier potassium channel 10 [Proteobacteria bacterium]|nr:ATP-sensitive inward rectifier potassium channel 10 [Pseudomonadota bacterium]